MQKLTSLVLAMAIINMAAARFPFLNSKSIEHTSTQVDEKPLILTPLIEAKKIQEARNAARVGLDVFQNITSYSGYFNVDKKNNGNLFFWFFPSASNSSNDPVVLWLNGGPGASSMLGLFTEHGPFIIENGSVSLREYSWHKSSNIIYIDQPVGTGYSFTNGPLVTNQTQVGKHLYDALIQFFTVFPELQSNAFFVCGQSYAGKYGPAISHTIHKNNPKASLRINLQGLLIGNGLTDPINQFHYGDFLYQIGLIDLPSLREFHGRENHIIKNIKQGNYTEATRSWINMISPFFFEKTDLSTLYNFLEDFDDTPTDWEDFIVRDDVRKALHVGNQKYSSSSDLVYNALYADVTKSVAPWISELLSHYRVTIYNGQLDIIVAYVLTENYLHNLNFSAASEYRNATRDIWFVDDIIAGYVKSAGNLTEILVRNAGHSVPEYQPKYAHEIFTKFINGEPLISK